MNYNDLQVLVQKTRTVRRFKAGVTIAPQELTEIVDLLRTTSSALNRQPLRYIVVTEPALVSQLTTGAKWASHLTEWEQAESEAPSAYILILKDLRYCEYELIDVGIALQTAQLLLAAKGYAGCPLASIDKPFITEQFALEESIQPLLGLAIGVQDEDVQSVAMKGGDVGYYRDENDTHCVPKRSLEDVLLGVFS